MGFYFCLSLTSQEAIEKPKL